MPNRPFRATEAVRRPVADQRLVEEVHQPVMAGDVVIVRGETEDRFRLPGFDSGYGVDNRRYRPGSAPPVPKYAQEIGIPSCSARVTALSGRQT